VVLIPGTEIRKPPIDNSWLVARHGEALQDFSDIPQTEKDYMSMWDAFVLDRRMTLEVHLEPTIKAFVEAKAEQLITKPAFIEEFSKHCGLLLIRGSISHSTFFEVTKHIGEVRARVSDVLKEPPEPVRAPPRRHGGRHRTSSGVGSS
jgi:hypothetical protein